jgi:hypothetical protein
MFPFGAVLMKILLAVDLSVDIVHYEQIPERICSDCMYEHILPGNNMHTSHS